MFVIDVPSSSSIENWWIFFLEFQRQPNFKVDEYGQKIQKCPKFCDKC